MTTMAIIGGGTMGADIAVAFSRADCATHIAETDSRRRDHLRERWHGNPTGSPASLPVIHATQDALPWEAIDIAIECVPETLPLKRDVFAAMERVARPDALLTSNSSSFPISSIAEGLATAHRMFGLHFFMPAHLVPLVEVVCGAASDITLAQALVQLMRISGKVPVLVRRDLPGFLANRMQHAIAREAFALIDAGVATPEDVDAAVRFGFGFRFLAAGPALQRDHAGLDIHCAAAATMYPTLAANVEPAAVLCEHVARGELGMKSGRGFYEWTPETIAAERARYEALLRAGLELVRAELPGGNP
jgi:3-hydroxybutyryl-CoA dehydrogenase